MSKKILLASFDVPGWGGASTSSYKLFELMRTDGMDVTLLNIIADNDSDYFKYRFAEKLGNPKGFEAVFNCFLEGPTYFPHPELEKEINKIDPEMIIGVGWIAALLIKGEVPDRDLIYLTTGCHQMDEYLKSKEWRDFISLYDYILKSNNHLEPTSSIERQAIDNADLIICHSDVNHLLYKYFYHRQNGKIHNETIWFAEWIYEDALEYSSLQKPFHKREIDTIFIASAWSRPEKNYRFVRKITSGLKGYNIHIVGEVEKKDLNATYHDLITDREELFSLLGNSKAVVSPSLFDSAPGILFEGSAMGCNVIASKNCGNWMLCNENLLVDPFSINNFLEKIALSLSRKYDDNINEFLTTNSYNKLIEAILVF